MPAKRAELAAAILDMTSKTRNRGDLARAVAAYMADQRRTKELSSLLRDIEELRFKKDGVLEVTAVSARPLSESSKKKVADLFEAKQVNVYEQIDPAVTGGVRVRALDKVADFSVQARIRRLRKGF